MKKHRSGKLVVVGMLLAVLATAEPARAQSGPDLWVLTESQQIFLIDTKTFAIDPSPISLIGLTTDNPTCMAFSTVAGASPSAFVMQGSFVRIVDIPTKTVRSNPINVAALVGVPEIDLTACSAARPRVFRSGPVKVTSSRLFVAGKALSGATYWAVLDQEALLAGASNGLVVDAGRLRSSGRVLDAQALDDPQGDAYQRAWFTMSDIVEGDELILNIPMTLPENLDDSIDFGPPEVLTLPTIGLPRQGVGVGSAPAGKFTVRPGFTTGQLTNLETGDSCVIPGNPTQLSVHGPGPNSYSVFALDPLTDDLLAIDPNDCSSVAFDVDGTPLALLPRRTQFWDGLFVLNSSGVIEFLRPGGDLVTAAALIGTNPVDGGVVQSLACSTDDLLLDKNGEDIELSWTSTGCSQDAEFFAWCNCVDEDLNCPCACDCTALPLDPDCACPFAAGAIGGKGIEGLLLDYNPGDVPSLNPWKKLESTPETAICHEGAVSDGSWFYLINQSDEPPAQNP